MHDAIYLDEAQFTVDSFKGRTVKHVWAQKGEPLEMEGMQPINISEMILVVQRPGFRPFIIGFGADKVKKMPSRST